MIESVNPTSRNLVERFLTHDFSKYNAVTLAVFLIIGTILTVWLTYLFVKTLLCSQKLPKGQSLVVVLALLTFISLTAALFTESAALETIAATGVGAIAGAVSHVFTSPDEESSPDGTGTKASTKPKPKNGKETKDEL